MNYDYEIEKKYHPENFEVDYEEDQDGEMLTDWYNKIVEFLKPMVEPN